MEKTIEEITKELEEAKKQRDDYLAGWQRERADLLNYKKDEMERIGQLIRYASEEFLLKVLPVVDAFERAEKNIPEDQRKNGVMEGFLQIKGQLSEFLQNQGVAEARTDGKFNPEFHEAVAEVEDKTRQAGDIVEVLEKGYMAQGKLLRPAKVKVAK